MQNTGCETPEEDTRCETWVLDTGCEIVGVATAKEEPLCLEIGGFKILVGILSKHCTELYSLPSHRVSIPHSNGVCALSMT